MIIRLEEEKDYFEVENLTRETFWNLYRPGCFEHLVIHNLRYDEKFVSDLDYVLESDGKIIGNIVYALGNLKLDDGSIKDVLIFGPVSIHPDYQKQGLGEKLISFTLMMAEELDYPCVLITGDSEYYKKFGFVPSSKYNIFYEGLDKSEESPFFMIKVLDEEKMEGISGIYSDPDVYNVDESELTSFDKQFPPKKKEKREGQLV